MHDKQLLDFYFTILSYYDYNMLKILYNMFICVRSTLNNLGVVKKLNWYNSIIV